MNISNEESSNNEKRWSEDSGRLKPVLGEQYGRVTFFIVSFLFILFGLIVMFLEGFSGALCLIPILVAVGYLVSSELNALDKMSKDRAIFLRGQSRTTAEIRGRWEVRHDDGPGGSYTYHLRLEFKPTVRVDSTKTVQFIAMIDENHYKRLSKQKSVDITYAVENPRIFVIDGE